MISIAAALVQCMILTGKGCRRLVARSCDLMQSVVIKGFPYDGDIGGLAKFAGADNGFGPPIHKLRRRRKKLCEDRRNVWRRGYERQAMSKILVAFGLTLTATLAVMDG